jgi:pyruvate, water dikinase
MSDFGGRADIKIRGRILKTGGMVTVSCAEGEIGRVYEGALPIKTTHVELNEVKRPRTEIMLNLGNPELAFRTAMLPNDGISERKLGAHRVGPV